MVWVFGEGGRKGRKRRAHREAGGTRSHQPACPCCITSVPPTAAGLQGKPSTCGGAAHHRGRQRGGLGKGVEVAQGKGEGDGLVHVDQRGLLLRAGGEWSGTVRKQARPMLATTAPACRRLAACPVLEAADMHASTPPLPTQAASQQCARALSSTRVFWRQMTLAAPMSPFVENLIPSLVTDTSTAAGGCWLEGVAATQVSCS